MHKRLKTFVVGTLFKGLLYGSIASLLIAASLPHVPEAYAKQSGDEVEDLIDETLTEEPLAEDSLTAEEAPPKPEYPYPGAEEPDAIKPAPEIADIAPVPAADVERPIKISEEGEFFYNTKIRKPAFSGRTEVAKPDSTNSEGEFFYPPGGDDHKYIGENGREKPVEIRKSGDFIYMTETSPQSASASIRFGVFGNPKITNPVTGLRFEEIYTKNELPILMGDYEWRLTSSVGRLGLKFTSGLFSASGAGQFVVQDGSRRPDDIPEERFTFLMFPNQLTAVYKFQYADNQLVVPYVEGGGGYFTFVELRDDGKSTKFGGSLVTVAAGGVNFLLDWIDTKSIRQLDNDYGVNHVWLTLEMRVIVGLNKDVDFTSSLINGGFTMDF